MEKIEFEKLNLDALVNNFSVVKEWLQKIFDTIGCQGKLTKQVFIAVDEIYTNICNYAYKGFDKVGKIYLESYFKPEEGKLFIIVKDNGIEYNPLFKPDPDIDKHIKEKIIGGLGIFIAKKMLDSIEYNRDNDVNTLLLTKKVL